MPLPPFYFGASQDLVGDSAPGVFVGARDEDALDCWGEGGRGIRDGGRENAKEKANMR